MHIGDVHGVDGSLSQSMGECQVNKVHEALSGDSGDL